MRVFATAVSLVALVMGLVGCDKRGQCTGWSGGDGKLLSNGSLTDCSDKKLREVRCVRNQEEAPFSCTCVEDKVAGKTFQRTTPLPNSAENLSRLGVEQCGWALK